MPAARMVASASSDARRSARSESHTRRGLIGIGHLAQTVREYLLVDLHPLRQSPVREPALPVRVAVKPNLIVVDPAFAVCVLNRLGVECRSDVSADPFECG